LYESSQHTGDTTAFFLDVLEIIVIKIYYFMRNNCLRQHFGSGTLGSKEKANGLFVCAKLVPFGNITGY
jgi:hypothetical protein